MAERDEWATMARLLMRVWRWCVWRRVSGVVVLRRCIRRIHLRLRLRLRSIVAAVEGSRHGHGSCGCECRCSMRRAV